MRVTCRFIAPAEIEDAQLRRHVAECVHLSEIGLSPGCAYAVWGVLFRDGVPWFYLCDETDSEYPKPYCSVFFEPAVLTLPSDWVLRADGRTASLLPRWWAEVPDFLERLLEGDSEARLLFEQAKPDFG